MAKETTQSKKPSQTQIIEDIRNLRKDLDAMDEQVLILENIRGADLVGGALFFSRSRIVEARMWLGRALAELGENASENYDKADEERTTVAPSRRESPTTEKGELPGEGRKKDG